MLMDARAFTEGMRALVSWTAFQIDLSHRAESEAARWLVDNAKSDHNALGAGSYAFMQLIGTLAVGWMWLRMAQIAEGREGDPFYAAKLVTARYYAERSLPDCAVLRRKIEAGAEAMMAFGPETFPRY
jgi:hypothetical protein